MVIFALLALTGGLFAACGDSGNTSAKTTEGDPSPTPLTFTASSAAAPTALRSASDSPALVLPSGVTMNEFWISLEKIKFEQEGEDLAGDTGEPKYEGPYYINLLDETGILTQSLGEVEIPAGTYGGIKFTIHKAGEADTPAVLMNRSLFLTGEITSGGVIHSFEIWHEADEDFLMSGPNGITIDAGTAGNDLVVDFNLDNILEGVDLTAAEFDPATGNYTGDHAISPESTQQANEDLSEIIKENLKAAADFGKDEDGDGVWKTTRTPKTMGTRMATAWMTTSRMRANPARRVYG
jgi:hypothetical protein